MESVDVAVIGAGVVGLALARAVALKGREVAVLESERLPGQHTSSRNSEVIHAGFYYPRGSLKARLCVAGARSLYAYLEEKGVPHRRTGKLVVATADAEVPALESYRARAVENGCVPLEWVEAAQARELEPSISCVRALFSPATGIVDSHELMRALRHDAEEAGAMTVLRAPVLSGKVTDRGIELSIGGDEPAQFRCAAVINSAGLWAQEVARSIEGVPPQTIPPALFARGHYFILSGAAPFSHLVYPIAIQGGLGVHVTLDLAGRVRFGPDVEWIDRVDYGFDDSRAGAFAAAIQRYYPALQESALQPGYTGIRPKLSREFADFVIQGPRDHGVPGLVNLYGIESPGLTACLSLADHAAALLEDAT